MKRAFLPILITLLALLFRFPYFSDIPKYNDEMGEVYSALRILQDGERPLTGINGFSGPLHAYAMALLFKILGWHYWVPRLLTLIVGCLTVSLTFILGRKLFNWQTGMLAALFLLLFPSHVILGSHLAWSVNLTPLFTLITLYFWQSFVAGRTRLRVRPGRAASLGAFAGLTLQAHPITFPFVIFLLLSLLFSLFTTRPAEHNQSHRHTLNSLFILLISFCITLSPLIIYNLKTNFNSLKLAQAHSYAVVSEVKSESVIKHFPLALNQINTALAGTFNYKTYTTPQGSKSAGLTKIALPILFLIGFLKLLTTKSYQRQILLIPILPLLIVPLFNQAYDGTTIRYWLYLFPILYLIICYGFVSLWTKVSKWNQPKLKPLFIIPLSIILLFPLYTYGKNTELYYRHIINNGLFDWRNQHINKTLGDLKKLAGAGFNLYYPTAATTGEKDLGEEIFYGHTLWQKTQFLLRTENLSINYYDKNTPPKTFSNSKNLFIQMRFQEKSIREIIGQELTKIEGNEDFEVFQPSP